MIGRKRLVDEDDNLEPMYKKSKVLAIDEFGRNYRIPACSEDKIATYLADLKAINPESIVSSAATEDAEDLCIRQSVTLDNLECYLKTCQRPSGKDLYMQLVKGVEVMYSHICLNEIFKRKFQQCWSCLHEIEDEYQDCYGPEDWTENTDTKQVCTTFEEISDCFYVKTVKMCGTVSAQMMKELTDMVIKAVITTECKITPKKYRADHKTENSIEAAASEGTNVVYNTFLLQFIPLLFCKFFFTSNSCQTIIFK